MMRRAVWAMLALVPALCAASVAQAEATPLARAEIQALIAQLDGSPCRFQRNGRWHDADAAREHLQRKYDYLKRRDMADTAELFIERAATASSMSGTAYRIACPGEAELSSAAWFTRRLQQIRQRGASTPGAVP